MLAKVLTGGQTGVDRAATDFALARGIAYGGWVPHGGWAEDFPSPPGVLVAYPNFTESPSADPAVRTVRNVDGADGVLVVSIGAARSAGSALALARARQQRKPLAVVDVLGGDARAHLGALAELLDPGYALNVAGPRESEQPGVYAAVRRFLDTNVDLLVAD